MPVTDHTQTAAYLELIRERLPKATLDHVLSVTEMLVSLAGELGIDADRAAAAGLLHDAAKPFSGSELLHAAAAYGIHVTDAQKRLPALLHGPVAAEEARQRFGIDDAVYEAVYWHTTGTPGWNLLGQALFVADFGEPLRAFPEAAIARKRWREEGFLAALRYVAAEKIIHIEKKASHDPTTALFYSWLTTVPGA